MELKKNQSVICVNDRFPSYCAYPMKKGAIYSIAGFYQCVCGSQQVTLVEVTKEVLMGCRCARVSERRQSYYSWRFKPLEYAALFGTGTSERDEDLKEIHVQPMELKQEAY